MDVDNAEAAGTHRGRVVLGAGDDDHLAPRLERDIRQVQTMRPEIPVLGHEIEQAELPAFHPRPLCFGASQEPLAPRTLTRSTPCARCSSTLDVLLSRLGRSGHERDGGEQCSNPPALPDAEAQIGKRERRGDKTGRGGSEIRRSAKPTDRVDAAKQQRGAEQRARRAELEPELQTPVMRMQRQERCRWRDWTITAGNRPAQSSKPQPRTGRSAILSAVKRQMIKR